jgi:hypothetical protein
MKSTISVSTLFSGGGEMGELMNAHDWSETPVGPVSDWPQSLKTAVRIILTSRFAMFVWWGRELVNLYNDPYRAFLGKKHPEALGKRAPEVWREIWEQIGPRTEAVLSRGESTFDEALLLLMERHGYVEETYFTFSYSPLPDDDGAIGGLFCAVTEETQRVIGERRLNLLREIGTAVAETRTVREVCVSVMRSLERAQRDLPFSAIYLADQRGEGFERVSYCGIDGAHAAVPATIRIDGSEETLWPFRQVMRSGEAVLVDHIPAAATGLPTGLWARPPRQLICCPSRSRDRPVPPAFSLPA